MGGLSRNGGVAIFYWGFSGDSSWCSIEKNIDGFIFPFLTKNVLQNNCLNKYEMIVIAIVLIVLIVIIAVLIIHANNKHSVWYFYLSYNVNKNVL